MISSEAMAVTAFCLVAIALAGAYIIASDVAPYTRPHISMEITGCRIVKEPNELYVYIEYRVVGIESGRPGESPITVKYVYIFVPGRSKPLVLGDNENEYVMFPVESVYPPEKPHRPVGEYAFSGIEILPSDLQVSFPDHVTVLIKYFTIYGDSNTAGEVCRVYTG